MFGSDYQAFMRTLEKVIAPDSELDEISLEDLLGRIPSLSDLSSVPVGSTVLVRTDLDMPVSQSKVADLSRVEANSPTIRWCLDRGFKVIVFGHLGRKPEVSVRPVCNAYSEELGVPIELVSDWIDEASSVLTTDFVARVQTAASGSIFMLENTRKYKIETALWQNKSAEIDLHRQFTLGNDIARRLATIEVNEAIAAGNSDFSSTVVPLFMARTALGSYIDTEFRTHVVGARRATTVVVSGLKLNKLDDLEGIVRRGVVRRIISAGSLAMALRQADAELNGREPSIGRAGWDAEEPGYISSERAEQARRILIATREKDIECVLPIDFVCDDGLVYDEIPRDRSQRDVGPKSIERFAQTVGEMIDHQGAGCNEVLFYNGVFGKFEEERFATATRSFVHELERAYEAGVEVFVGGGEGQLAVERFGRLDRVTHAFTAGGTILKAMSNRNIGYLKAMYVQNSES